MMKRGRRIVWLAAMATALATGCTAAEESVLGAFVCDFLRSAIAAYHF